MIKMGTQFLITTLTPIHIGNGNIISPQDYYYDPKTNQIKLVSFDKVIAIIQNHFGPEEATKCIDDLVKAIEENVDTNQLQYSIFDFLKELGLNPNEAIDQTLESVPLGQHKVQINQFISTGRSYYIPGSSVKGAIRTAYLYHQMKEAGITVNTSKIHKNKKWAAQKLEQEIFGNTPFRDIFKTLSIGDSIQFQAKFIHISQVEKTNISTNNLVLSLYMQTCYLVDYKKKKMMYLPLEVQYSHKKHKTMRKEADDILANIPRSANMFSKDIMKHEIEVTRNQSIRQFYQRMVRRIENYQEKEKIKFILPIGYGTGFLSKTMALLLEPTQLHEIRKKYRIGRMHSPVFPIQRSYITKMATTLTTNLPLPMGWTEITVRN